MKFDKLYPKDVALIARKRTTKRKTRCLTVFLLLIVCGIVIFVKYIDVFIKAEVLNIILFTVLYLILCCYLSKFPFALISRSYIGVVKEVHVRNSKEGIYHGKMRRSITDVNIVELTLIPLNKKRPIKREVFFGGWQYRSIAEKYEVGDTVCFLDGTEFPYVIPKTASNHNSCVMCGLINVDNDTSECLHCGHSLMSVTKNDVEMLAKYGDSEVYSAFL